MRISSLVSAVVVLAAAGASFRADAQQPITVICGNGTSQTAGVYFDSLGRLVFSEPNVCGSTVIGVGMPDPLNLIINSPGASNPPIDVSNGSQQLSFEGNVGGSFDPDYDSCALSVNPLPSAGWSNSAPLTVGGAGAVSRSITFDQGIAAGQYDLSLNCSRIINQQQVIVPSATRAVQVVSGTGGGGNVCADQVLPPQFSPLTIAEFNSGYGVPFGQNFGQTGFPMSNVVSGGVLQAAQVRSWRFTAPASGSGQLFVDASSGNGGWTLSISKGCPALFSPSEGVPAICTFASTNGALGWRASNTPTTDNRCVLDPGETYYMNAVYLKRNDLNRVPRVFSNGCSVGGQTTCLFTMLRGQTG